MTQQHRCCPTLLFAAVRAACLHQKQIESVQGSHLASTKKQQSRSLLNRMKYNPCVLQVLFSSSVMYGNFVTIAQRRVMAKEAQEHKDR